MYIISKAKVLHIIFMMFTVNLTIVNIAFSELPPGILPPEVPIDNSATKEKIALGKKLYFDKRLSVDDTVSCASCHDPEKGFADGLMFSKGVGGKFGNRNAPTVINAAFYELQFWDGREVTLEDQAKGPLINPVEMAMPSHKALEKKLNKIKEYKKEFKMVFGTTKVNIDDLARAIASFERTIVSVSSPFDKFIGGDNDAISDKAKAGWKVFNGKARCDTCHGFVEVYPFFTDNKFHNIGVDMNKKKIKDALRSVQAGNVTDEIEQFGRYNVTKEKKDLGAYKTPGLRNISLTAPYMHDGSEPTLMSVINFYNRGGNLNPNLDGGMKELNLTGKEKANLVEFLKSLTSDDVDDFVK